MAYLETGRKASMSGTKKNWITGISVVLAVILVIFAVYLIHPRFAVSLVTSEAGYTKYVAMRGLSDASDLAGELSFLSGEDTKYEVTGNVSANLTEFGANELGGVRSGRLFTDYLANSTTSLTVNKNGGNEESTFRMTDGEGAVLTVQKKQVGDNSYLNIPELSTGWMLTKTEEYSQMKTQLESIWNNLDGAEKKCILGAVLDGYNAVKDDISYKTDKHFSMQLGEQTATGTRCNILMNAEQAQTFVHTFCDSIKGNEKLLKAINKKLPDTRQMDVESYENLVENIRKWAVTLLTESGLEKVNIDLYTNTRNQIIGLEMMTKSKENDLLFGAILKADEDQGKSVYLRVGSNDILQAVLTPEGKKNGVATFSFGGLAGRVHYRNLTLKKGHIYGTFTSDSFQLKGFEDMGGMALELVLSEGADDLTKIGASINSESLGSLIFNGTLSEGESSRIAAPKKDERTKYDRKTVTTQVLTYFLEDLPKKDRAYNNMYKNIINGLYQNLLTQALLSGDLKDVVITKKPDTFSNMNPNVTYPYDTPYVDPYTTPYVAPAPQAAEPETESTTEATKANNPLAQFFGLNQKEETP